MPREREATSRRTRSAHSKPPEKLSLIVSSGDFERVHYALAMASAAVAIDRPATLFFTMGAIRALLKPAADGAPGWADMAAEDGRSGAEIDAAYGERGVGQFEELLTACIQCGARFMVCEMGLRAIGLGAADLRQDIAFSEGGLVSFLNDASRHGAVIYI